MDQKHTKYEPDAECPICGKYFEPCAIQEHANRCIFLNSNNEDSKKDSKKRSFSIFDKDMSSSSKNIPEKKLKITTDHSNISSEKMKNDLKKMEMNQNIQINSNSNTKLIPLAEKMRPETIEDYVGQDHIMSANSILRKILDKNEIPSMILWGPPGVGKTSLAHVIANRCKQIQNTRFVKLSATMSGVNDIKTAVTAAKNELKFGRKTILFMDEIHRFNKLQQDIFLPHVESGVLTLIGATTENPSFSLNSALLSRCRVIVLEKLPPKCIIEILKRSLRTYNAVVLDENNEYPPLNQLDFTPKISIEESSLKWLAEICDGDARIALSSLQLALESCENDNDSKFDINVISFASIKDGIKKSHMLYDRQGDQHYDMISALHKSIRASDENAALYWCTRMIIGGEDPRYICRRLVRAASEDIGLADPTAVSIALSSLDAVQLIGMPESDCILAQTAVYLARAPKSREIYDALNACKNEINEWKGPQPSVPLHLRNKPPIRDLNYGNGYSMDFDHDCGSFMPAGLESRSYFS